MRIAILYMVLIFSLPAAAQQERDTVYRRCPLYITDTVSSNNFFIEGLPATITVDRLKGDLKIIIKQKDQFFTLFFADKRLKNTKYKIGGRELTAKYSFRSGDQVSYVDVSTGTAETSYDKEKKLWRIKVNGLIANLVERSVTYYRVRTDFYIR
jgi:hypothetical protein